MTWIGGCQPPEEEPDISSEDSAQLLEARTRAYQVEVERLKSVIKGMAMVIDGMPHEHNVELALLRRIIGDLGQVL